MNVAGPYLDDADVRNEAGVAITAVARELCGFVWAIMKAAPCHQAAA